MSTPGPTVTSTSATARADAAFKASVAPKVQFNASNAASIPSMADLKLIKYSPESNAVASPSQIDMIFTLWRAAGVPEQYLSLLAIDIARHCADVGSSKKAVLSGVANFVEDTTEGTGSLVARRSLAAIIKTVVPLRQFCRYYARVVWNMLNDPENPTPPANWSALEYKEESKFAAFDFFDAIDHTAALQMPLVREPTEIERVAHATQTRLTLTRRARESGDGRAVSYEVTAGRLGKSPGLLNLPEP
uniref:Coat protein n=1 Tax=Yam virus X TaxID=1503864 RepID=A0A0B4VMX8_9VIRU|nr:coat protein [Yam virus X]